MIVIVLGLLAVSAFVGWVVGHETRNPTKTVTVGATSRTTATTASTASTATTATTATTGTTSGGGGDPTAGKAVFLGNGCGGCHTLAAAGTSGNVGPNLDEKKPSLSLVVDRVTHGKGAMPPFADSLSEQQIKDVAAYVVQSTGGG